MAGVKALSIRGIRSFGPEAGDQQQLAFSRPLTLILGANGCGKTTIIECLRYAVTGQQPPGARNECFVYDARVNKTREVLAQARLKIVNANGSELTVTRSMQVTSKEKRTQFKTLDGSIERINEKGERVEISSRCADIDYIMQQELGVSKAIINYVIFCHQEDSLWPLDEGKKVKDRFDEIFDADKYSDCFDRLKKIRKEYAFNIKLLEVEVLRLSDIKSELDKKKLAVVNSEARISEAELKIVSLTRDIKPVTEKLKAIEAIQMDLVNFETKKEMTKARLEHCLAQQKELNKAIKNMFSGTEEELKQNIDSYESLAKAKQHDLQECREQISRLSGEEQRAGREVSNNEVEFNKLILLEGQNQDRIHQRNSMIGDAATVAGVTVPEELESQAEAAAAMSALASKLSSELSSLEQMRSSADADEKRLQRLVDDSRDALSRHKQKIQNKESELQDMRREVDKLERQISETNESKQRLDTLQAKLEAVNREYEVAVKELDCDKCQSEINEDERTLERLDTEAEQLSDKITKLQKQSAKLAEKLVLEESLAAKEKALNVLKNKHRAGILELLQRMPDRGFAVAVSEVECSMRAEVDTMKAQLKQKQHQVTKLESERTHVRELLKGKRVELTSAEDCLYEACGSATYEATLAKCDSTVVKYREEENILESSVYIISKYKKQLQENSSCPLCNRGFDSQSEVMDLISDLTTRVFNVPAKLDKVKEELSRASAKRDELVQLKSLDDKIRVLKEEEIPHMERRVADLDKQLSAASEAAEELSMSLMEPEQKLATAKQLAAEMPLLDKYVQEIQNTTRDLKVIKDQCSSSEGGLTLDEAMSKQTELRQKITTLRSKIKLSQSKLNLHTKKLQTIMQKKNHLKEEHLNIQKKVQELCSLQESLKQLLGSREKTTVELKSLRDGTALLETELREKDAEKSAAVAKSRSALETKRSFIDKLKSALEKIKALEKQIEQHERNDAKSKISRLKESNQALQSKRAALVAQKEELTKKVDALKDELSKQEIYKRDLEDNAKLRRVLAEGGRCEQEIAEIEASVGGIDTGVLADKEALIRRQTQIFTERANTEGRIKELKVTLNSNKLELMRSENKDAERNYRAKFYELQVVRALDKDIKEYSAAMDKCLMQFHKEKMENINLIIREMWRKIYRGNDIDYIEIKTGDTDTEKDRRKYEYRVVQSKNGVEIDMRGRCSAGQKVLACLIIRLALAETFSTRFGVLALDEPTTNLDQENVKSLCGALGDIVAERMRQKNFMFIIITHDRDFIESLGQVDKVSHFYEVSRNDDGKSRIKKVKFT